MAHKSNGYIYTDDAVPSLIRNGVITFYNRLERYQEQAATLVMHGGKQHERVFTESEVRAIIARLPVQAMVGTPCVMLEDIAPAFGLSDHG